MARKSNGSPSLPPLEHEMRRLYRLPLGEFTAVRNALAKQLQTKGDGDAADQVKALPKPSVSAWAVNQLFAREADRMRALLAAGEQARKALQHTLTAGDAEALREALQEEREQRDELRQRAAEILSADLRAPGQAILDRVAVNLDALALSPGAAEEAARGWLSQDLEPPGFEVLAGLQFAAPPPDRRGLRLVPSPPTEKRPAGTAAPEPRHKAEEAARERAAHEREEERRRARIERAQEKADRLAAEADALRRDSEKAEREAAEAERTARDAARRAGLAREDADRIRRRAERAADDAERAEKDLEAARR